MGKNKKSEDEKKGPDVGMVMTVSLFLILLTFFILLNSIAVLDERKVRVAIGSLIGAFGSLPGGLSPMKTGDSILPPTAPMTERALDVGELLSLMDKYMTSRIKVVEERDTLTISINEKSLFYNGTLTLKPSSYPLLKQICEFARPWDYAIDIVGHTDNLPAEDKGYRSNWEVSVLMATQVLKYFVETGKILPQRLTAYGAGSTKQITSNDSKEARMQNRRVDVVLYTDAPEHVKRVYRRKPAGIFTYKKFNFKIF